MATHEIKTRIIELVRRTNTVDGNPRWKLVTTHGNYYTADNASVNYEISPSLEGHVVVLTLGAGAKIVDLAKPCKVHGPHTKDCPDPCVHDGCLDHHGSASSDDCPSCGHDHEGSCQQCRECGEEE